MRARSTAHRCRVGWIALTLITVGVLPSTAEAFEAVGGLHATGGIRWFDERESETRPQFGGNAVFGGRSWPLVPCVYYTRTEGEGRTNTDQDPNTYDFTTSEVGIGLTRLWGSARVRPYVGGGWARSTTRFSHSEFPSERDRMWLGAGLLYRVGRVFDAGLGGRFGSEVSGRDDVATWSAFALLGVGWPLD